LCQLVLIPSAVVFVAIGVALLVKEASKGDAPVKEESVQAGVVSAFVLQRVRVLEEDTARFAEEEAEACATQNAELATALREIAAEHRKHCNSINTIGEEWTATKSQQQLAGDKADESGQLELPELNLNGRQDNDPVFRLIRHQEAAAEFYVALAQMTTFHQARDTLRRLAMEELRLAEKLCTLADHPQNIV